MFPKLWQPRIVNCINGVMDGNPVMESAAVFLVLVLCSYVAHIFALIRFVNHIRYSFPMEAYLGSKLLIFVIFLSFSSIKLSSIKSSYLNLTILQNCVAKASKPRWYISKPRCKHIKHVHCWIAESTVCIATTLLWGGSISNQTDL